MKKLFILLLMIPFMFSLFCCGVPEDDPGFSVVDPVYYPRGYDFNEMCSNGDQYIKVTSFEISPIHEDSTPHSEEGSGYYVIVGVDTNFSEDEISNLDNYHIFWPEEGLQGVRLIYSSFDDKDGKLFLEIPKREDLDCEKYCTLKNDENRALSDFSSGEYKPLSIMLQFECLKKDSFTMDLTEYRGRIIEFCLSYETE